MGQTMRYFCIVCCTALLWQAGHGSASEIELLLPPSNVSSRIILEFRARKPMSKEEAEKAGRQPSRAGHAYVLLGRELGDGMTFFNHVRGFYADRDDELTLVQKMYAKGVVKHELDDAASDVTFRVYITPIQEAAIRKLFRDWDDKKYSLVLRNCVDFTREVALAARLKIPHLQPRDKYDPQDKSGPMPEFPTLFVLGLRQENDKETPLRTGTASPGAIMAPQPGANSPMRDPTAPGRATQEQIQRARDALQPFVPPVMAVPTPNPPPIFTPPLRAPTPSPPPPPPPPSMPPKR